MTQSKTKTIILENDPLHKEKAKWAKKYKSLIGLYIKSIRSIFQVVVIYSLCWKITDMISP